MVNVESLEHMLDFVVYMNEDESPTGKELRFEGDKWDALKFIRNNIPEDKYDKFTFYKKDPDTVYRDMVIKELDNHLGNCSMHKTPGLCNYKNNNKYRRVSLNKIYIGEYGSDEETVIEITNEVIIKTYKDKLDGPSEQRDIEIITLDEALSIVTDKASEDITK